MTSYIYPSGFIFPLIARCLIVVLFSFCLPSMGAGPVLSMRQLTQGPKNHFFGYIGQCRTVPWNGNGRYILALQTTFQDRMPTSDDAAEIVLIDTRESNAVRLVERTRAWNPQQGTMFYWNPQASNTQFFFNDRDPKSGKVFAVLFDIERNRRVREYRFDDTPVGNSGVAQAGGWLLAINYGRLARLRPVTGYPSAYDWTVGKAAPKDDGVFRIDVETGEKKLIVSFAQLKKKLQAIHSDIEKRHLFINHTLCNRDGDRVYFYCRADFESDRDKRLNEAFTVKPDGSELTRQPVFIGGHPDWAEGTRIIGAADNRQVIYDTAAQKIVETMGGPELFPNPGGDIALSPDGRWLVNGHGEGEKNVYTFLERATGRVLRSPGVPRGKWTSGDLRLDPAPCWNRTSDAIVVPGIASDGSRQIFLIEFKK